LFYNSTGRGTDAAGRYYLGFGRRSDGNVQHCAEHDISPQEVEEVLENATDADISRSSGRPVVFGDTSTGRHLMVVFEFVDDDTVYPVTAYEVPRKRDE
jgi:uncharacterized DUF497 family protein